MKKVFVLMLAGLVSASAFAQTTLPAEWNFDDPQPVGWTESLDNNPGLTRYTNGQDGAACKLDGDDEFVVVNYSDVCGSVTYYIAGQGSASNDVFSVQESANGTSWTDMRVFEQADLDAAGSFTEFTDVPQPASRYIRWYFTEKQSGRNVGLDEITLEPQQATLDQEIAVSADGNTVVNNGTVVIGNNASMEFDIENVNLVGGAMLNISNAQITGANAADFSLSGLSTPTNINAASSLVFDVNFSTVETGSRFATLTISNNDANGDETTFVINLYAIGGDYATEPTEAPTNLTIENVTTYGYDVSFADATVVPENYIVLRGVGNQNLTEPEDGTTYVKGDWIDAVTQVVYVGPADSFKPTYNVANTTYYFTAYSFNGPQGYENYLTSTPLSANVTTPTTMVGNYYNGVDANSASFLSDLQTRISQNYNQLYYSSYAPVMLRKFASRDTTGGQKVITDVYSGFQYLYTGAFFFDVLSREHTWPFSWMPTWPDQEVDQYSDFHNLFPVHQDNSNAVRSNLPLGVVVSGASTYLDATVGDDANGNRVYEPRDQHKGDAARAIFYMATKWNGAGGSWQLPNPYSFGQSYGQDQDLLKQWHLQDPPDNWEIARNDFIESEQGNRNPFVDSVNWVCYIDFSNMSYVSNPTFPCNTTPNGIEEYLVGNFSVSPNPSNGIVTLNLNLVESQNLTIELMDISGRLVSTQTKTYQTGTTKETFDLSHLVSGIYHLVLKGDKGSSALKVVLR